MSRPARAAAAALLILALEASLFGQASVGHHHLFLSCLLASVPWHRPQGPSFSPRSAPGPPHDGIRGVGGLIRTTTLAGDADRHDRLSTSRSNSPHPPSPEGRCSAGPAELFCARVAQWCDHAAAVASLPQRNSVPSSHMRCRTMASLRATATIARFIPRRRAIVHAPGFQAAPLLRAHEQRLGALEQRRAHHRVAALRHRVHCGRSRPTRTASGSGRSELRPGVTSGNRVGHVHSGLERQRDHRSDAWCRHQPAAERVVTHDDRAVACAARCTASRSAACASSSGSMTADRRLVALDQLAHPLRESRPCPPCRPAGRSSSACPARPPRGRAVLACSSLRAVSSSRRSWLASVLTCTGR